MAALKYLLAHDLGTSGNKATLFTTDGKLVKSTLYTYSTDYFNSNWAEQDAGDWWEAVCSTTREILQGIDRELVASVSFSGQMMGCLCVGKDGEPLRKSIIWADQRAVKEADYINDKIGNKRFYRITGHRISPAYGIQKLMWIKNNEPGIYEATHKMLNSKDYIIYKLTGRFVTDFSDATGTTAFDLNTYKWSDEIISATGIDAGKLPELKPSTYVVGGVTRLASEKTGLAEGTPVVCGGGDGVCATVGAGCIREGMAYNVLGSSSWISMTSEKPIYDEQMRTFNFAHIIPGFIAPCGAMQAAGVSYSWLRNEICTSETEEAIRRGISPYELINDEIEKSPAGANGLIYLPYLLGERSPRWNPNARGAFIGLKMEHKRADILRSVLEGVTLNLDIILKVFAEHTPITEITAIGGGAKGRVWRQIMADIYGIRVLKPNFLDEATSMGAAVTGGVGAGVFKDFSVIGRFIEITDVQEPVESSRLTYEAVKPIFEECYASLVKVFDKMAGN